MARRTPGPPMPAARALAAFLLLPTLLVALAVPRAAEACGGSTVDDLLDCVPPCPAGCVLSGDHWLIWNPDCPPEQLQCDPHKGWLYVGATFFARAWGDVPFVTCTSSAPVVFVHNDLESCTIVTETYTTTDRCLDVYVYGHALAARSGTERFETRLVTDC